MNYIRNFKLNILNIKDFKKKEVSFLSSKEVCIYSFDNNPSYTIRYMVNPANPSAVFLSNMNSRRFSMKISDGKIFAYDTSSLGKDVMKTEEMIKNLQVMFYKFSIPFSPYCEGENDCIFHHIIFMHNISAQLINPSPFVYKIKHVHESSRFILMENTSLLKIFDSIQTWLSIPFIKLSHDNFFYIKQFEFLESYLKLNEDLDGLMILKQLDTLKLRSSVVDSFKSTKSKIHLEIYQLNIDKSRKSNDLCKKDQCMIVLHKIVDLQEDEKSYITGTIQMNQKSFFTKSFESILAFLEINYENILYQKETQFMGNITIPIKSLQMENTKESTDQKTRGSRCQDCHQDLSLGNYQKYFLEKEDGLKSKVFCSKCYRKHLLIRNIKKIFNMTYFDAIVQFFFYFPNLGQMENENSFSIIYRNRGLKSSWNNGYNISRMRISITDNNINIHVKKSFGIDNVLEMLGIFINFVCTVHKRKSYYFLNYAESTLYHQKLLSNSTSVVANTNIIQNIYSCPMKDFDKDIFTNIHKAPSLPIESFIPEIKYTENEMDMNTVSCKEILKYFSYTRYCDKRRMPEFSFEEPDNIHYFISRWPPIDKFNKMNQFTIHVKSPKFDIPIKIIWNKMENPYARFIMFIKKKRKKENEMDYGNFDEKIIEFSTIFFYIHKKSGNFLSITKLSPAFLPSITIKEKKNNYLSTYMTKQKKLQGSLHQFIYSLYNETDVDFFLEQKYTLQSLLQKMKTSESGRKDIRLSLSEQVSNKVEENDFYLDIQNIYHYCCHVLQANIIVLVQKQKNELAEFKEISCSKSYFHYFDRYIILVETLDDKTNTGIIHKNYQPLVFQKKNLPVFHFFEKQNSNSSFMDELETIYKLTILKHDILYHHDSLSNLTRKFSHQIIDTNGSLKFLVHENNYFFIMDKIPILELPILQQISVAFIQNIDCPLDQLSLFLQNHIYHILEFTNINIVSISKLSNDSNIMICSFHIPFHSKHILLGFMFCWNSTLKSFPFHPNHLEILFYLKAHQTIAKHHQLNIYKSSFSENNVIKHKLLSSFMKYYSKRRSKNTKKEIISNYIQNYIIFKENYNLGDFKSHKKLTLPIDYKTNIPSYLSWFLSIKNYPTFLKALKLQISFSFDFKKRKHTLIK